MRFMFKGIKKNIILSSAGLTVLSLVGCSSTTPTTSSDDSEQSITSGEKHAHTYSDAWEYDEDDHWHPSTCGHDVVKDIEAHDFKVTTNEENHTRTYECKVCDYSLTRKYGDSFDANFYNGSTLLYTCKVYEGEFPAYEGETPQRPEEGKYYYKFIFYY